jgi:hypothetical protein
MKDPTDSKRQSAYLARCITRPDKCAGELQALRSEFKTIDADVVRYRAAYHDHTNPAHADTVQMVYDLLTQAGDWVIE